MIRQNGGRKRRKCLIAANKFTTNKVSSGLLCTSLMKFLSFSFPSNIFFSVLKTIVFTFRELYNPTSYFLIHIPWIWLHFRALFHSISPIPSFHHWCHYQMFLQGLLYAPRKPLKLHRARTQPPKNSPLRPDSGIFSCDMNRADLCLHTGKSPWKALLCYLAYFVPLQSHDEWNPNSRRNF